jgi:hypothetical protein
VIECSVSEPQVHTAKSPAPLKRPRKSDADRRDEILTDVFELVDSFSDSCFGPQDLHEQIAALFQSIDWARDPSTTKMALLTLVNVVPVRMLEVGAYRGESGFAGAVRRALSDCAYIRRDLAQDEYAVVKSRLARGLDPWAASDAEAVVVTTGATP